MTPPIARLSGGNHRLRVDPVEFEAAVERVRITTSLRTSLDDRLQEIGESPRTRRIFRRSRAPGLAMHTCGYSGGAMHAGSHRVCYRRPPMKYVLFYDAAPDFMPKVPLHIEAHRALWKQFHDAGTLLMIGPFTDEPMGSALAVFTTRAAAETFVSVDPFVKHGLVARHVIREWNEVLAP